MIPFNLIISSLNRPSLPFAPVFLSEHRDDDSVKVMNSMSLGRTVCHDVV